MLVFASAQGGFFRPVVGIMGVLSRTFGRDCGGVLPDLRSGSRLYSLALVGVFAALTGEQTPER
ncbi:MAG: hypothetical protein AAGJ82_01535 [Bacteroidota bacterium]